MTTGRERDQFTGKREGDVHERERWQVIKALLRERSLVRIAEACRATGVSEASIRRDFARLAEQGVAMLSSVLRSARAVQVNIAIIQPS